MLFVGLLSPVIISILFGKKYAEAHAILSILAIGIPIRFIATSVGSLLVSGRNMRNKSYIMGVVAVINLGSNALLIPVYGLYGKSEEHTSELQSLMRITYAVFCLKKKNIKTNQNSEK